MGVSLCRASSHSFKVAPARQQATDTAFNAENELDDENKNVTKGSGFYRQKSDIEIEATAETLRFFDTAQVSFASTVSLDSASCSNGNLQNHGMHNEGHKLIPYTHNEETVLQGYDHGSYVKECRSLHGSSKINDTLISEGDDITFHESSHGIHKTKHVSNQSKLNEQYSVLQKSSVVSAGECWENVKKAWHIIEQQCSNVNSFCLMRDPNFQPQAHKVVRVFVSSTFADFHSEREILVKRVFPALREWCNSHHLQFIECDLRWGVPKETTTSATIRTCLEEIDRCYASTDGKPFFIGLIGERYGWIPSASDVAPDVQKDYQWIPGISITHMEILHGAYRPKSCNAIFLFRNESCIEGIPSHFIARFRDDDPLPRAHLRELKSRLRFTFPKQVFDYQCRYEGVESSTGTEKVVLSDLENFGWKVIGFFKDAIKTKYPQHMKQMTSTPVEQETDLQNFFVKQHSQLFLGREQELGELTRYATEKQTCTKPFSDISDFYRDDKMIGNHMMVVIGEAGIGKTALLARLVKNWMKSENKVFYHFVEATPTSRDPAMISARLIAALTEDMPDFDVPDPYNMDFKDMDELLKQIFPKWLTSGKELLIVLDAVDMLSDNQSPGHLSYVPHTFPGKVKCVASCKPSSFPTLARLENRKPYKMTLNELCVDMCEKFVERYLGQYNKKLDPEQMLLLVSNPGSKLPLWLAHACEELRVFGEFTTVTNRIKSLPPTKDQLLADILRRLVSEDATGCLETAVFLIAASQNGIPEKYMRLLLGDYTTETPIAQALWSEVRRNLKAFCRNTGDYMQRYIFTHSAILKIILEKLNADVERVVHKQLANFYENYCSDRQVMIVELPYHLYHSGQVSKLVEFLRSRKSFGVPRMTRQKYLQLTRCCSIAKAGFGLSQKVYACKFCSVKQGLTASLKNSCTVCLEFIPKILVKEAYICHRHRYNVPPNWIKCFYCEKMQAMGNKAIEAIPLNLCHICGGPGKETCCKLGLTSKQF